MTHPISYYLVNKHTDKIQIVNLPLCQDFNEKDQVFPHEMPSAIPIFGLNFTSWILPCTHLCLDQILDKILKN